MTLRKKIKIFDFNGVNVAKCDICCIYGSRPYGDVGAALWATLRSVTFYVVMTAHAY